MKAAVLGTGMIGGMIVRELAKSPVIEKVVAVDAVREAVDKSVSAAASDKVAGEVLSLTASGVMEQFLQGFDVAVACLPHELSLAANQAAIKAGCHMIDLVGSRYPEKARLDPEARVAGILLVIGLGVAPGLANILAGRGIELMDRAEEAQVFCGGLPRHPLPPLWYQVVFRLESVMGLYTRPASAMIDNQLVQLPALSGLEEVSFPEPVGECEAVITDAHSLAFTMKGRVKNIFEKTVRYKGHYSKVGVLAELGFMDEKPVNVCGTEVSARRFTMALLEPLLKGDTNEDITALRVIVKGLRNGRHTQMQWDMVDFFDRERGITSMAKTTGFPAVVAAEWIAKGLISQRGVMAPEQLFIGERFKPFLKELEDRGINVSHTVSE